MPRRLLMTPAGALAVSLVLIGACSDGDGATTTVATADTYQDSASPAADVTADVAPETMAPQEPAWTDIAHQSRLVDLNPDPSIVEVELTASTVQRKFFDIPVDIYAYNGQHPGPLLQARVGDEVIVHFTNQLPEPTTVHWHGLRVPDDMDGSPRIQAPVQPGETFTYRFTVPDAGTFWYHPHVRSNEQVEKGLYGPIVVEEQTPPQVDGERFVVMDDLLLFDDGIPEFLTSHPEIMHGRTGNVLLINGQTDPIEAFVDQGLVERWRIVNTANARTMEVSITGASWRVVGTDGGLLPQPYETERLQVAVGQRYDLEVRYDAPGPVRFENHVLANSGGELVEVALPMVVMEVLAAEGTSPTPDWAGPGLPVDDPNVEEAQIAFNVRINDKGNTEWTLNDEAHAMSPMFTWAEGDVVDIELVNQAGPEHPFHLHGQFFQILTRNGAPVTDEPGLKDTVLVPGIERVTIRAYMDNPGMWMAHCHILEHAELGMMAEIEVTPAP